ncbi:MAG: LicD family protein, partial [Oscillospiraceae bacterium]|nr:LicD family protein [Oscillospiraceae bacterium]
RAWTKNAVIQIMHSLPEKVFSVRKIRKKIIRTCKQKAFDQYGYGGNLVGAWGRKEIMKREYFGEPTLYRFEDTLIYGAEKYDEYLTALYGDWRTLPPKEKQVSHHAHFVDLDTPYAEYKQHREQ